MKNLTVLNWSNLSDQEKVASLSRPEVLADFSIQNRVREMIADIRTNGDRSLRAMTKQWDGVDIENPRVEKSVLKAALESLAPTLRSAIERAEKNIRAFHEAQKTPDVTVETQPGVFCFTQKRPLESVGIYIPAGTAPLLSTALMLAVPARVAGCQKIVLMSPPLRKTGCMDASILAIAEMLGLENVFCGGGAQAIAAMAYGTETIPKVDKIFGPGNAFVTEAKQQVSTDAFGAAIDIPAGPSEVLVIADEFANPTFVAADLISQAEHDKMSQVLLITTSENLGQLVRTELERQLLDLPRRDIATVSLASSRIILVKDIEEAFQVSNRYAPEHLILQIKNASNYLNLIQHAGSVFVGAWSPEAIGDYASGTNHVLPTFGFVRSMSGVNLNSFLKVISFQELTAQGLLDLGPQVEILATAEDLIGHKRAVSLRLQELRQGLI